MSEDGLSTDDVKRLLIEGRNWGRWGKDDENGAINLIDDNKRLEAAAAVRRGVSVSLSRPLPKEGHGGPVSAALHFMRQREIPGGGIASDWIGTHPHGVTTTHLDALCHIWDQDGMWGGRDPKEELTFDGARWGGIQAWRHGIVTRGVLIDVGAARPGGFVAQDEPVTGEELERIARAQGVEVRPGDALVVHSGRDTWQAQPGQAPYSSDPATRPGLHASCLVPLKTWDCSMLIWDMLDARPTGYDVPFTVHGAIFSYGLALVDNAGLQELAEACAQHQQYDFLLNVAPLWVEGGTSSPVNPIAVL